MKSVWSEVFATRLPVIDAGEIAESGLTKEVFAAPQSQAAKQLLDNDF